MSRVESRRIWVYWNGTYSRIRIPESGAQVELHEWSRHEEGWQSSFEIYWIEANGKMMAEFGSEGSDCDGRHESFAVLFQIGNRNACDCQLYRDGGIEKMCSGHYSIGTKHGQDIWIPTWDRIDSGQRDHFAEAMGY